MTLYPGSSAIVLSHSKQLSFEYIHLTIGYDLKNFTQISIENSSEIKIKITTDAEEKTLELVRFKNTADVLNFGFLIQDDQLTISCNKKDILYLKTPDLDKYCAVAMRTSIKNIKSKIIELVPFHIGTKPQKTNEIKLHIVDKIN